MNFEGVLTYLVGQIPVALNVMLTVQGFKVFGITSERLTPGRVALGAGLFFGLGGLASALYPEHAETIAIVNTYFVGSMSAGLFYRYLVAPVFDKLGWSVSNEDLNK